MSVRHGFCLVLFFGSYLFFPGYALYLGDPVRVMVAVFGFGFVYLAIGIAVEETAREHGLSVFPYTQRLRIGNRIGTLRGHLVECRAVRNRCQALAEDHEENHPYDAAALRAQADHKDREAWIYEQRIEELQEEIRQGEVRELMEK